MHINNISQKAASFILHKRFHPGNFKNMEKVWIAEQRVADAARKDTELTQKRAQEMKIRELRQRNTDGSAVNDMIPSSIQWVYAHDEPKTANPSETLVSSTSDVNSNQGTSKSKRGSSKYVLEEPTRFGEVSDADLMRKLREDPLMQIKKAEILRSRKEESKREIIVKRPRWDRPAACDREYVISDDEKSEDPTAAVMDRRGEDERRSRKYRKPPSASGSDDGEDLGPSSQMKSIIRTRHAEAVDTELKKESAVESALKEESGPDDLQAMLARGRDHEDERKLRVERLRLMERSMEEADKPRSEMPAFKTRLQASVLDNYDREKALRNRKHDASLFEDRKYHDDDLKNNEP